MQTTKLTTNSQGSDWIKDATLKYPHLDIQLLSESDLQRSSVIKNLSAPWIWTAPSGARLDSRVQTHFKEEPLAYEGRDAFIYSGTAVMNDKGTLLNSDNGDGDDDNDGILINIGQISLDLSPELANTFWGSLFARGSSAIVSTAHLKRLIQSTTDDLFTTIHQASVEYLPALEPESEPQRQAENFQRDDTNLKLAWKKPILSVIVSLRTTQLSMLDGMLNSLCHQSFHDFEVVFFTEESIQPMDVFLHEFHCIRYRVFQLDASAGVVNNVGGLLAYGEYLAFLDPHDVLKETCLEKLVWALEMDSSVDFAYPGTVSFGPDQNNVTTRVKFDSRLLHEQNFIPSLFIIRKSIFIQYGGIDGALADGLEEYDLWLRLTGEEKSGRLVPEELYLRQQVPSRRLRLDNIQLKISDSTMEQLKKRNPKAFGMKSSQSHLTLREDPNYQTIRVHPKSFQLDPISTKRPDESAGSQETLEISPIVAKHHAHSASSSENVTRVLYFIPFMVVGGSEKVDLDILSAISDHAGDSLPTQDGAKFHVTLIVDYDPLAPAWEGRFLGLTNEIFVPQRYCSSEDCTRKLVDYLIRSRNPSILFVRNSYLGYEAARKCKQLALPIQSVDLLHLYIPEGAWEVISLPYHSDLDRRLVISNDMRRHMNESLHLPLEAFDVIYNGVDFENDATAPKNPRTIFTLEPRLKQFSKIVGYAGRIAPEKDPMFWLNVALELVGQDPGIGFVVIGDGDLKRSMQDAVVKYKAKDRIFFVGYQDNPRQLFPDIDVLVTTSLFEGLPLVVVDAVYQGVPVVARNVGAVYEVIQHDYNGYLLDYDAPAYEYVPFIKKAFDLFQGARADNRKHSIESVQQDFSLVKMKDSYRRVLLEMSREFDRRK